MTDSLIGYVVGLLIGFLAGTTFIEDDIKRECREPRQIGTEGGSDA